jgi:hypothetical protein
MLFALGAVSSALDALQSITAAKTSPQASGSGQAAANPFELPSAAAQPPGTVTPSSGTTNGISQISPQTMSALLAAQSQSTTATASSATNTSASSDPLQNLFSLIDGNGDGKISKSEFESALGAGGTNLANADSVFNKLDKNGDGSVSLDEMKSALQGKGGGGHHHHAHVGGAGASSDGSGGSDSSGTGSNGGSSSDPLLQALAGSTGSTVTNSDGSTTTSITNPDGSKITLVTPAASTSSSSATSSSTATASYNFLEKMIQREAQALSSNATNSLAISA